MQLAGAALLLVPTERLPPVGVLRLRLQIVDPLQRLQRLVQQERRVVHQDVDEHDELLTRAAGKRTGRGGLSR